jgi:hypothetical protein
VFSGAFRFYRHYVLCLSLIACSPGDNNAVSVVVKPVFGLIFGAVATMFAAGSGVFGSGATGNSVGKDDCLCVVS